MIDNIMCNLLLYGCDEKCNFIFVLFSSLIDVLGISLNKPCVIYMHITSNIEAKKLIEKHDNMMIVDVGKAKARTPLAMLVPQADQVWINYVDHWIAVKKARGFFEELKDKWKL